MRSMKALLALVAAAALAPAVSRAGPPADSTQGITDTTILIGSLGPFTGEASVFDPLNYGPEAYLRYTNAQGGIFGRKFKTIFADSACNEAKGIAAAKKLIYEDKVFMIMGNPCSGVAMAIKPMLDQAGVPWIGISANPKLTTPPVPNMYHTTYTGVQSGRAMASFALSKPGVTKIALIEHSNDWAHGYCDPAADYVRKHGGTIVATTVMERGATDATAQALRIRASGAQAVMGCLYQQELVIFIRAMHKFRVPAIIVGALGADFEQTVAAVGRSRGGARRVLPALPVQGQAGPGTAEEIPRHLRQVPDEIRAAQAGRADQFLLFRRARGDRHRGGVPPRGSAPHPCQLGGGDPVDEEF